MRSFVAALRFLTLLPLPGRYGSEARDLAGSVWFFPLVGLLLGAVAAAFAFVVPHHILPAWPAAVLTVILLLALSGALHMDGLSDTADGFLSSRSRERILEIMKDSRTGAMGVMAVCCTLLLKAACLAQFQWDELFVRVLLMVLAGRCMMVISIMLLPYARSEGGLGTAFFTPRGGLHRLACSAWALGVLAAAAWALQSYAGLVAAGGALAVTLLFAGVCSRKIGGATGDTLGATCEIAETVTALCFSAYHVSLLVEPDHVTRLLGITGGAP